MTDIKLQKYISECGIMSRRACEREINDGFFTINGVLATIGDRVNPLTDKIAYKGKPITLTQRDAKKVYICLNKPSGYITTMSDQYDRKTVKQLIEDIGVRLYPVGRLDMDTEGMLICTNDGELTNALTHPSSGSKKLYTLVVKGKIADGILDKLRNMRTLDDEKINPVEVELLERDEQKSRLKVVLTEGKNRQIRRMCESVGVTLISLKRIAIGGVFMGKLESGKWRYLTGAEISTLKRHKKGAISNGKNL